MRKIPSTWFRAHTMMTVMEFIRPSGHRRRAAPIRDGERELSWLVLPPFQRPAVWSLAQKIRFVESAWMRLPLGVFIWNRGEYGNPYENWLLDGQQRVTALLDYMGDSFSVYGFRYSELSEADQRSWEMSTGFHCMVTDLEDEDQLREIYDRLAYGGTPHEPKPEPWLGGRGPG